MMTNLGNKMDEIIKSNLDRLAEKSWSKVKYCSITGIIGNYDAVLSVSHTPRDMYAPTDSIPSTVGGKILMRSINRYNVQSRRREYERQI